MDRHKTPVIFRETKTGDIVAFFPAEPWDRNPYNCASYEHIGQHGAASLDFYLYDTIPTTEEKAAALKAELESIGYNLQIRKRFSSNDFENRISKMN